jgi:hypothetical protein
VVFISVKAMMKYQSLILLVLNERPLLRATDNTINPATANLMPAKSILLPVMSGVMPKSLKPTLMSGNAHPQAIAAVRANTDTQTGRWNMEIFVCSTYIFL